MPVSQRNASADDASAEEEGERGGEARLYEEARASLDYGDVKFSLSSFLTLAPRMLVMSLVVLTVHAPYLLSELLCCDNSINLY